MATTRHGDWTIFYETFGDPTLPTLLLVNGLGSQCINYADDWCRLFANQGFHVVRYDNRDVGLSSHIPDASYTCNDMAADGIAVLDALGVARAHVMGLSMGGMIVQMMAILHPDRLITMTSVMSHSGEPDYFRHSDRAFELLTAPSPTSREEYIQQWIDGLREWGSPEWADESRWRADAERAFDRCFDPAGAARQYQAIAASEPRADRLRTVTTPTLVMHGDRDTLIDQIGGRRVAELIPGARFVLIEGMGHDYPPQLWQQWVELVTNHARQHS